MRRLLIPAALAAAALAAAAAVVINLVGEVYNAQVFFKGKLMGVEAYERLPPQGVWLGPYYYVDIFPQRGSRLVFYIALANTTAYYEMWINDEFLMYIMPNTTHIATPSYKLDLVMSNSTHRIYRMEVAVPNVYSIELYVTESYQYIYVKFP